MKKSNELFLKTMGLASALMLFQGCTEQKAEQALGTETLTCDTTVFLKDDVKSSPSCKINYSLAFFMRNSFGPSKKECPLHKIRRSSCDT